MNKRRDNKGRVLRSGEIQKPDGKYEYRYTDHNGVRRSVYSWKLVETDKTPNKKRMKPALRTMENEIAKDLDDGIKTFEANRMTLNAFFESYIEKKIELKQSTKTNYKYMYKKYVSESIGLKNISDIKYSHIKDLYLQLIYEHGFKPKSVETIQTILHPIFSTAVRDGYIRLNPTTGVIPEIKRTVDWENTKRHALTVEQQEAFMNYVGQSKTYRHWKNLFTVFLGTGCRAGEITGLRWEDCDFKNNIISINHNLVYRVQDNGKCEFHITTPKTRAGIREIPMMQEVKQALLDEKLYQMKHGFTRSVIDGYSGFIFQNRFGDVFSFHLVNRAIERIRNSYNLEEIERAKHEHREPLLLPYFSAHHLRHTFCTRFCENETNLKVIQEIMGHANISTTMDIYNEATMKTKKESFANLEGKIKIS